MTNPTASIDDLIARAKDRSKFFRDVGAFVDMSLLDDLVAAITSSISMKPTDSPTNRFTNPINYGRKFADTSGAEQKNSPMTLAELRKIPSYNVVAVSVVNWANQRNPKITGDDFEDVIKMVTIAVDADRQAESAALTRLKAERYNFESKIASLERAYDHLKAEREEMVKALEIYANEKNWIIVKKTAGHGKTDEAFEWVGPEIDRSPWGCNATKGPEYAIAALPKEQAG